MTAPTIIYSFNGLMQHCWECSRCWFNSGYETREAAERSAAAHLERMHGVKP
jgi:hypothetical protein